jgi:hypothetical protein
MTDYPVFTDDPIRDAEAWMEHQDRLAAQHDARVAGWYEQIWDDSLDPYKADRWAGDYEALVNENGLILEAAAHAKRDNDPVYLGRFVLSLLDKWAKETAEHMAKEFDK